MEIKYKLIIRLLAFITLLIITISFIYAQSSSDDTDDMNLIDSIDTDTNLSLYDKDTFSFLIESTRKIINIYNPNELNIIDFDVDTDNNLRIELSENTLDFLYDLDLDMRDSPSYNPYSRYVEPAEMRGYNFVLVEFHQPIPDNEAFNKLKCYYKIYLNNEYVGNTDKGPWVGDLKFFAYNLERGTEYKIKMEKMVAAMDSNDYKPVALKMYQPDEYLEDIILVNDTPDRIIFLLLVWRQNENGVYEAIIKTEENSDKYLKRNSSLWSRIKEYYLNQ